MIKEFCAENFTDVPNAIKAGASRIELCDNLSVGGTTPSYGVIQTTVEYADKHQVDVMVIIRPRGGDFTYNKEEVLIMCRDILMLEHTGITGIVIGAVKDGWIDEEVMEELLKVAGELEVTFHMAFDEIDKSRQLDAINWLAERGGKRILTHGGEKGSDIQDNMHRLLQFIQYAGQRITILPGGGITYNNAEEIAEALSINELHGTKIVHINERHDEYETIN